MRWSCGIAGTRKNLSLPVQERRRYDGRSPAWESLPQLIQSYCQGDFCVVHLERLPSGIPALSPSPLI